MIDASIERLWRHVWQSLGEGAADSDHPYHTPVLGTIGRQGPSVRTVVLRAVEPGLRQLVCHTDSRSTKVVDLRDDPRASWLFYDPRERIQLRLLGPARLHVNDAVSEQAWRSSSPHQRREYAGPRAPGERLTSVRHPDGTIQNSPVVMDNGRGSSNFAVLICEVHSLDWLQLGDSGHRRAQLRWSSGLSGSWVEA